MPTPPPPPGIRVVNAPPTPIRDAYHAYLRASWWRALGAIALGWLLLNALFAGLYDAIGGVANARPGSFVDALDFSIQTMGTIGYGAMYPTSGLANLLVDVESLCGLVVTAVATGLVFAKFTLASARIAFTREATIAPHDGVPTLMIRVGNERGNRIVDAVFRIGIVRTDRTKEGVTFYRMIDLQPVRERAPALTRSLTVMHRIDASSPLYGETPETWKAKEIELSVAVSGTDDVTLQPVYALHTYTDDRILWGWRHADILSEQPDGTLLVDIAKFHEVVPAEPTPDFPYAGAATPEAARAGGRPGS